jgi:hypothetical protein
VGRVVPESALPEKQLNALLKSTCRIVFRTREGDPTVTSPRQVCALQDSFTDVDTGLCCVYEVKRLIFLLTSINHHLLLFFLYLCVDIKLFFKNQLQ